MKRFFNENKKMFVVAIIIVVLVVSILLVASLVLAHPSKENILKNKVTALATEFYKDFYQNLTTNNELDIISDYNKKGLTISLSNLLRFSDDTNIDGVFKSCDYEETKVTIYPKKPYKVENIKFNVVLKCDLLN